MPKRKKVPITEFGDESNLAIVQSDIPEPSAGEVQVAVEYFVVSGSDANMRRGAPGVCEQRGDGLDHHRGKPVVT